MKYVFIPHRHSSFGPRQIKLEQDRWELQFYPYDAVIMMRTKWYVYIT